MCSSLGEDLERLLPQPDALGAVDSAEVQHSAVLQPDPRLHETARTPGDRMNPIERHVRPFEIAGVDRRADDTQQRGRLASGVADLVRQGGSVVPARGGELEVAVPPALPSQVEIDVELVRSVARFLELGMRLFEDADRVVRVRRAPGADPAVQADGEQRLAPQVLPSEPGGPRLEAIGHGACPAQLAPRHQALDDHRLELAGDRVIGWAQGQRSLRKALRRPEVVACEGLACGV
jgi:hypothetical protein